MTIEVKFRFKPRPAQREMIRGSRSKRWAAIVAHRRAGKTVAVIVHLVLQSLRATRYRPKYAYISPFYKQSRKIAWNYLVDFAHQVPGCQVIKSDLTVVLPNQGEITLFGADKPDALRGQYWDGVVLDEVAQMRPEVWGEIIRPALADRGGWAVFIGTPKGQNLFFDLWNYALGHPEEWFAGMWRASETGIIKQSELDAARREMSEEQYLQEFECDFSAANPDSVIPFHLVQAAEGRHLDPGQYRDAPLIFGLDVARFGDDRSVLVQRQGLAMTGMETWRGVNLMTLAQIVGQKIQEKKPDGIFVDADGLGAGVVDRLDQLGFDPIPVHHASKSSDSRKFLNLRAEMWWRLKEWLALGGCIPDDPGLRMDLLAPKYLYDAANRIQIEGKKDMKKRGLPSPDKADALALTFAMPIYKHQDPLPLNKDWSVLAKTEADVGLDEWFEE